VVPPAHVHFAENGCFFQFVSYLLWCLDMKLGSLHSWILWSVVGVHAYLSTKIVIAFRSQGLLPGLSLSEMHHHPKDCCVLYGFFSCVRVLLEVASVLALRSRSLMKSLQLLLPCCVLKSWCIAIVLLTIFDNYSRSFSNVWL